MGLRLLTCTRGHVSSRPCPYAPASWLSNLTGRRIHPEEKVTSDDDVGGRSVHPEVGVEGFAANHPDILAGLHLPARPSAWKSPSEGAPAAGGTMDHSLSMWTIGQ